jgi:uncharacterized protein YigA (DUF484 family)
MTLFDEYQRLARSPTLSYQDLRRMANIMELAAENENLFSAITNLEYLLAQEDGELSPDKIQKYQLDRANIVHRMGSRVQGTWANSVSNKGAEAPTH